MHIAVSQLLSIDPSRLSEATDDELKKLKKGSAARRAAEMEAKKAKAKNPGQKREAEKEAHRKRANAQKRKSAQSKKRAAQVQQQNEKEREQSKKEADKARKSNAAKGKSVAAKRKERIAKLSKTAKGRFKPGSQAFTTDGRKKVDQVPSQVAHCMMAVRYKRKKSTKAAWNICRWSLTKHGYLKGPYREKGKVTDIKQTRKGTKRTMQHSQEKHPLGGGVKGSPERKYDKFSRMFRAIEKDV